MITAADRENKTTALLCRWPHRIAVLLTVAVFPLIWLGGMVTTTDAGMAVPDWPNTYGYNMFLYPMESWLFGPFDLMVEHGHRLLASIVGLIAIGLVAVSFKCESRRWVKIFSIVLLVLVIFQGALGGARVLLDARLVAKIHGCVGPLFFSAATAFCVVTSRWWLVCNRQENALAGRATAWMSKIAVAMLIVSFGQLVIGAFMRHVSIDSPPSVYILLVAMHVITASLILVGTLVQWCLSRTSEVRGSGVRASVNFLLLLVFAQIGLGIATWVVKFSWPAWFESQNFTASYVVAEKSLWQVNLVTAHVAVGSLILAFWTVQMLRCQRSYQSAARITLSTDT
jgi:cytochrome c oxidase assembly protein subunit 15